MTAPKSTAGEARTRHLDAAYADFLATHVFCNYWSFAGVPAMSLHSGFSKTGLPLGIQLVAAPFAEERLLCVARWCEAILNFTAAPSDDALTEGATSPR